MEKVQLVQLGDFAKKAIKRFSPKEGGATLVTLSGDLGAGKTTFVQALARELGISDTVQSPTYVLMKSYPLDPVANSKGFTKFAHIDAYRLNDPQEFKTLKPEEFLHDPKTLILLEWPERVEGMLPKPDLTINFSSNGAEEGERFVEIIE